MGERESSGGAATRRKVAWMHIVTFAFATAIAYVLAVISSSYSPC